MRYLYYPGCSLEASGRGYDESVRGVFRCVGLPLEELQDWNCCGATAYMAVDEGQAFALAVRNLALAEAVSGREPACLVAPCSACYLVLNKAQHAMRENTAVRDSLAAAMRRAGLGTGAAVSVRHPLDILAHDAGLERIRSLVTAPLSGARVACYYGCQVVRPYATFDDQHDPHTMDDLLRAAGAETLDWPLKARCCGGSLTGTVGEAGQRLSHELLAEAKRRGADVLATCCPLCQFNLECYQGELERRFGGGGRIPVVYFTQLLGKAMGLGDRDLGLHRLFVPLATSAV